MLTKRAVDRLDWGACTPDHWNEERKNAVYLLPVFVGAYEAPKKRQQRHERIAKFAANVVIKGGLNLPRGATQTLVFDIRGQGLSEANAERLRFEVSCKIPKAIASTVSIELRS
jgi:hypothetical protein